MHHQTMWRSGGNKLINKTMRGYSFRKVLMHVFFLLLSHLIYAQKSGYTDGRPSAALRVNCIDAGVILKHGDGPDSCDVYGAREAIINRVGKDFFLFYDGAGRDGWLACLAKSKDLKNWYKKGAILTLGDSTKADHKSASSPWVIKENNEWHMFYLGTPNTSPAPDLIPAFPYLTMKAKSRALTGPWIKQYNVRPFNIKENTFYSATASPGFIIKYKKEYLQFFSASAQDGSGTKRTLGLAKTKNLNGAWTINNEPLFPLTEQVENSSMFFDTSSKNWYLFTNHIGINNGGTEYTDAVWVYWSKNPLKWDTKNKAIVLDKQNCTWAKGAIGMPGVIQVGNKLALLYDAVSGDSVSHMNRDIGLAWVALPLKPY